MLDKGKDLGFYGQISAFVWIGCAASLVPTSLALAKAFMVDFYKNLFDARHSYTPTQALRQAQLKWIGQDDVNYRSPKYWAPYVLVERM